MKHGAISGHSLGIGAENSKKFGRHIVSQSFPEQHMAANRRLFALPRLQCSREACRPSCCAHSNTQEIEGDTRHRAVFRWQMDCMRSPHRAPLLRPCLNGL